MNPSIRRKNVIMKAAAILLIIGGILVPVTSILASTSEPRDSEGNSIIWGGCYSKQECFSKIDNGDGHHSAANIQQIYFNENRSMTRNNFNNAVDGVVYKNGDVRVNGELVATGARSVGRDFKDGSVKSGSVWERPTQTSFVADSIPAYVNMDGGTFRYFVIKSCGNWGHANAVVKPTPTPTPTVTPSPSKSPSPTPVQTFACLDLIPTQPKKATEPTLFRFTVTSSVNNVTLTGFRFTFSDTNQVVDTDADTPFIDHTITAGTVKVQGQVKTSAGITEVSEACSATVTITKASPSPTPSPTSSPTGHVLGATLPSTGPEAALGGIAGLSAIGWASRAYLRSRKSVVDALRKPRQ